MTSDSIFESIEKSYRDRTRRSADAFEAAKRSIPGGASRSLVVYRPYPIAMTHGDGARFEDADGNSYLDFVNCHSALVHGHGHRGIASAIQQQAERGTAWSFASEQEEALARLLCERVSSIEQIRFCCSGTEAGMYVTRIARAFTGRNKILKFEGGYHGSYDDVEVSKSFRESDAGPADDPRSVVSTLGFPSGMADRVVVAPFNDEAVTARRFRDNKDDLAAVLVEPVMGSAGMIPPEPGFLPWLAETAREHGVLLVADEVVSFRLAPGGAQQLYGFQPDLTMLGKVIGGGLPVAGIGGRKDILALSSYEPLETGQAGLSLSGTFSGAAIGMAAGRASLESLDASAIEHINGLGDQLRQGLRKALASEGVQAQVTGVGSLLQVHFTDLPVRDYRGANRSHRGILSALHLFLLNRGIATYTRGAFNVSTPMTGGDIKEAVDAFGEGLGYIKPYISSVAPQLIDRSVPSAT